MNVFDKLGLGRNREKEKDYLPGEVLKAVDGAIIGIKFTYAILKSRTYEVTSSAMPGYEFLAPKENIKTYNIDVNFLSGDKVKLADGRTMTVKDVGREDDPKRALMGFPTLVAWILNLEGGAPRK